MPFAFFCHLAGIIKYKISSFLLALYFFRRQSLLDLNIEEKKLARKALEGAAASHFDGIGSVMNTDVSFSDDEDDADGFEEGGFIDGGW